ncbi:MAG: lmo0937 family membrane protein [Spirosomataceae bacterium]
MGNLWYTASVVLLIAWAFGYFAFGAGILIHFLLIAAIVAVAVRAMRQDKITK